VVFLYFSHKYNYLILDVLHSIYVSARHRIKSMEEIRNTKEINKVPIYFTSSRTSQHTPQFNYWTIRTPSKLGIKTQSELNNIFNNFQSGDSYLVIIHIEQLI
jgi:hypothetical protein